MTPIALDIETTTNCNASPFADGNEDGLVCWSYATSKGSGAFLWDGEAPVSNLLSSDSLVVGANFKFDMNWLTFKGVDFSNVGIWDVLVAQFILERQTHKFPSLDHCAEYFGLPKKLDLVKTEFWDKGIDTKDIPSDILLEYAEHDSILTLQVYAEQMKVLSPRQIQLIKLLGHDTKVLSEMESNGLTYDTDFCAKRAVEIGEEIAEISQQLSALFPGIPINFNSPDQLSAILYGGTITEVVRELAGFFKTGKKIGEPRYSLSEVVHQFPQRYKPLKGTETKKAGIYKTSEDVLRKLKGPKKLIELLLRLAKLDKLKGTYYEGLPKLNEERAWKKGKLHGKINQTLAATGRLTASEPNQQNFAGEVQEIFVSEFE